MWPESSSINNVNLMEKNYYSSRDVEFFLGDYYFLASPVHNVHVYRFFSQANGRIATKPEHDGLQVSLRSRCAQGQGQGQRSRNTGTFVLARKSLLEDYWDTWNYSLFASNLQSTISCIEIQLARWQHDCGRSLLSTIALFLPCDALRCTVFVIVILSVCPSVRPSVCLPVTLVHCVHMVQPTIMIFSPYGSPIILVSGDITFIPKFERSHPERGR